jgi:hypothetical protein
MESENRIADDVRKTDQKKRTHKRKAQSMVGYIIGFRMSYLFYKDYSVLLMGSKYLVCWQKLNQKMEQPMMYVQQIRQYTHS